MAELHTLSGFALPVLFLKATVRRQITVPTFTRHDGTVVPTHTRMVLVSTDHNDAHVLAGNGSHSQRRAHAELSRNPAFHQLSHDDRLAVLLAHATDQQDAASRSAALSGWRQRANAGQNPTRSQWEAFYAQATDRKTALLAAVTEAVGSNDHLRAPNLPAGQAALDSIAAAAESADQSAVRPSTLVFRGVRYRRSGNEWEVSRDGESWGRVLSNPAVDALNRGEDPNQADARVTPPAERGAAPTSASAAAPVVVVLGGVSSFRAADFSETGNHDVTVDGALFQMHRDPESGWWYRAALPDDATQHFHDKVVGFSKQEALAGLAAFARARAARYAAAGTAPPVNPPPATLPQSAAEGRLREGATKVVNGTTYVLRDGRWHRQGQDAPVAAASGAGDLEFHGYRYRRIDGEWHWQSTTDSADWRPVMDRSYRTALDRGVDPNPATRNAAPVAPSAAPRLVGAVVSASAAPGGSPAARIAAMAAVPVPTFPDTSESNRGTTRRAGQLQALAQAGDYDAVANFPTSRTRSNYAALDDYRLALLAAAQNLTAQQASAAMRQPVPRPPEITGANMQNTALLAAKRKCAMLYAASRDADPITALMAITTSRGNRYLNAADDYKRALLAHFGHNVAGNQVSGASAENGATGLPPTPTVRPRAARPAAPAAAVERPAAPAAAAPAPVPDSQNPAIAANPLGLSEAVLGFVPRPNVPLSVRTNDGSFQHADPRVVALNRRYLAQDTTRQSRAREYQAGNWRPQVPRTPAEIEAERVAEAARQAAEMAAIRAAAAQVEARMGSIEQIFKPRSVVGANIAPTAPLDDATKSSLQTFFRMPAEQVVELMKGMVADYDSPGKFSMRVTSVRGGEARVQFSKPDGTQITREFSRLGAGIKVYHAYFKAGRTGNGSGKHLFRCSMGVYKAMGVTQVGVTANIDVGGYAWAKFGYKPKDWGSLRSELSARLASLARGTLSIQVTTDRPDGTQGREARQIGGLTPAQAAKVQAVLDMNSDTALWALADMRLGERQIGKELLLGTCWGGVMKLSDADVMKRFTKYIKPEEGGRNA